MNINWIWQKGTFWGAFFVYKKIELWYTFRKRLFLYSVKRGIYEEI